MIESDTSRDSEELNVLASRCGVTEYQVFGLAFYDAHGYQAEDLLLQNMFMEFLQCGAAPTWLRSYVRNGFQRPKQTLENIKQSAMISTGARNAIVKWRPTVDIFTFTLVGHLNASDFSSADGPEY